MSHAASATGFITSAFCVVTLLLLCNKNVFKKKKGFHFSISNA